MTANVAGGLPQKQRPFGVSVIATLATLSVVLSLLVLLSPAGSGDGAIIGWLLTIVSAVAAYGLWNMRPWAWMLALIIWALGTIDALFQLTRGTINTNLIVGPPIVLYLLQSSIQAVFRDGD